MFENVFDTDVFNKPKMEIGNGKTWLNGENSERQYDKKYAEYENGVNK